MKSVFPLFFLFIVFGSCNKKSHDGSFEENSKSIEGLWELRKTSSMLVSDYPPGNGRTIKFTGNKYEMRENGQITQSGDFSIIADSTASESTCLNIAAGQYAYRIMYGINISGRKVFLQLTGDTLTFISGCFAVDAGVALTYERL